MTGIANVRGKSFWAVIALLVLITTYCTGMPNVGQTGLRVANLDELRAYLLSNKPDVERFRDRGPFRVTVKNDIDIALSVKEHIKADLYLATWGMHSLALSLPNHGPWTTNGNALLRVVNLLHTRPEILDNRIDPARIIVAGHSFGASALAVALGKDAPALGGIMLDPAGVGRNIPPYLRKMRAPVVVIASDDRITMTRNRGYFFTNIPANVVRVSITNASHEDAQFPLEPAAQTAESDTAPLEVLQMTYVSALTSAALSLGLTGKLDYAWESFAEGVKSGRLFDPLRK